VIVIRGIGAAVLIYVMKACLAAPEFGLTQTEACGIITKSSDAHEFRHF
jgi:hypothetical protein